MKKNFKKSFNCHCDECANTTKQSTLSKWIASLPAAARNDGKYHKTKREKNILFWRRFGHCLSTKQNIFDRFVIKRAAFTLAEVLITLVIIGVIAALTIPNLMQKYKKHQVEVQLKAAYSILNNALSMAKADGKADSMSDMIDMANASGDRYNFFAENYLVPYLKVVKTCKASVSQQKCGIFEKDPQLQVNGVRSNSVFYNAYQRYRILLKNGMNIGVGTTASNSTEAISFLIDINGNKSPNRIGYDLFYFMIHKPTEQYCLPKYCERPETIWGDAWSTTLTKFNEAKCEAGGFACAAVIQRNNWKIPDDYPVKKW